MVPHLFLSGPFVGSFLVPHQFVSSLLVTFSSKKRLQFVSRSIVVRRLFVIIGHWMPVVCQMSVTSSLDFRQFRSRCQLRADASCPFGVIEVPPECSSSLEVAAGIQQFRHMLISSSLVVASRSSAGRVMSGLLIDFSRYSLAFPFSLTFASACCSSNTSSMRRARHQSSAVIHSREVVRQ